MLRNQHPPIRRASSQPSARTVQLPTFLDHIHELRRRLFWVVGFVLLASAAAFPFQQHIMNVLTAPLGHEKLYYITPVGGFSFLIKVCTYVGILVAIPLIIYHLYRYLEPLMQHIKKSVLFYVSTSSLLALGGILFAYFISLPAALHFLTNINLGQVQAMLTVDSYLAFVMTYLLGAALLFQIPLVLMIINGIRPLPPKQLMGFQRYVLLGAFIIAAIISPTPDVVNQAFLAAPIIVMYQVGIVSVWTQQRKQRRAVGKAAVEKPQSVVSTIARQVPMPAVTAPSVVVPTPITQPSPLVKPKPAMVRSLDGFSAPLAARSLAIGPQLRPRVAPVRRGAPVSAPVRPRYIAVPQRSVDGIISGRAHYTPAA